MSTLTKGLLNDEIISALNYRIKQEEESSRLYHAIALQLADIGYANSSKLWEKWSAEELVHAKWAKDFLASYGVLPKLEQIELIDVKIGSLADAVRESLLHEIKISAQCNTLAGAAIAAKAYNVHGLAMRYVNEQVDEIAKLEDLAQKIETFGSAKEQLFQLDLQLANY